MANFFRRVDIPSHLPWKCTESLWPPELTRPQALISAQNVLSKNSGILWLTWFPSNNMCSANRLSAPLKYTAQKMLLEQTVAHGRNRTHMRYTHIAILLTHTFQTLDEPCHTSAHGVYWESPQHKEDLWLCKFALGGESSDLWHWNTETEKSQMPPHKGLGQVFL